MFLGRRVILDNGLAAMREMLLFYKQRIEECNELARHSSNGKDQAFWEQAAGRWSAMLRQYEQPRAAKPLDSRANTRRIYGAKRSAA
jgi:hypothetical protein